MNLNLKFYLSLFIRRLPYFLVLLAIGSALGLTLASVLPPVYKAEAVLIVESQQIPGELAATTVQTEATEQLQIIQQRILTRDSLLEMANRLEIYPPNTTNASNNMAADEKVEDLRERISIVTTGGAVARGPVQATIVSVSFEAPTSQMSSAVTNEVVTMILRENILIRTNAAGQTLEFFENEVARLDQDLKTKGAEILAFQERNLDSLPDSLDFRRSQQAAAQERLLQMEREEAVLRDRRERLILLYERTGQVVATGPAQNLTPEARQLKSLQDEHTAILAVLSPTNPRVRVLAARIAVLEVTVAAQGSDGPSLSESGLQLTAYEIQLADLDGQLDFMRSQREQIAATMETLRVSIEATPGNAITLDTLQRDYANIRGQYDQAVGSRAAAETGDTLEALAKGQRITVIEQAIPPREPESPNRPLVAAAGIAGGLFLGLGLVILLELLNKSIRRPADLTSGLGITPFGTVPHFRTQWERVRRRAIFVTVFAVLLIGLPGILLFVHTQVTPLNTVVDQLFDKLGLASLAASVTA
ncbi:MAG: lipopolysaccharide biosynthesis protein [Rhodobacteraceae bacterium]|nr:lipopolysaccharide biosynthesis protein [Paracoccaceae bacterium]